MVGGDGSAAQPISSHALVRDGMAIDGGACRRGERVDCSWCVSTAAADEREMNGWDQSPQSVSRLGPLPLDGRAGCRMSQHGADELVLRRDLGVGLSGRMSLARALSGDETSLALHCMAAAAACAAAAAAPKKMARRPHEDQGGPSSHEEAIQRQGTSYQDCPPST